MDFPGATLDWGARHYLLRLEPALQFLSSALLGEGFTDVRWVYSQQVSPADPLPDLESSLRESAESVGIPPGESFVGLMTAVSHQDLQIVTVEEARMRVTTLATVGVEHGTSALDRQAISYGDTNGLPVKAGLRPGTINIVTLVDGDLSPGALVRASTVATEAKSLALAEAGLRTRQGHRTTGTSTDATVVGHTGRGVHFRYAGSATLVGWLVGYAAYHCVKNGLAAYNRRKRRQV